MLWTSLPVIQKRHCIHREKHRQSEQQRQLHHSAPALKAVKGRYVNP
ncbi:hypothetical protein CSB69_1476 [Morganella morganii]|nr:hypothetical protein CSB69_1476 [Morganella morganii]EMP50111.1 hypothetical protein C790_02783 [Morganella morganii SC01]